MCVCFKKKKKKKRGGGGGGEDSVLADGFVVYCLGVYK